MECEGLPSLWSSGHSQLRGSCNKATAGRRTPKEVIPSKSIRRGVARLRGLSRPLKNKLARIAPRSSNDYASHIPILVGIAQGFSIRRVLELGSGPFSTPTFLNETVFIDLEQLHSYETDHSWFDKSVAACAKDRRFKPHFVNGAMSASLHETELRQFDLIFVDDSTTTVERVETIRQLANRPFRTQLIAIHDFEVRDYRDAASTFEHKQIFRAFTPQTGVVWNGSAQLADVLKKLNRQIIKHSKRLAVDDVDGWRKVFTEG